MPLTGHRSTTENLPFHSLVTPSNLVALGQTAWAYIGRPQKTASAGFHDLGLGL